MPRSRTLTGTLAAVLVATALAGPAVAQPLQDRPSTPGSPALGQERYYGSYGKTGLRSPDARDAAEGRGTFNAPDVTVIKVPEPAPTSSGIDWGDAGIGAGSLFGLMLLALGSAYAVVHRRQRGRQTATAA